MGLREQIASGAIFSKQTVNIPQFFSGIASGSIVSNKLAGNYILLSIGANKASRVRLYQDSSSVLLDAGRPTSSFDLDNGVGLNIDAVLEDNTAIRLDPPILCTTYGDGTTWYHVSSSLGNTNVSFTVYNIGKVGDSTLDRSTLTIAPGSISGLSSAQGDVTTRKSFLLLSGSSTHVSRLRLYSTAIASVPAGEIARSYGTTPGDDSYLIAEFMFDTASYGYKFSPILEGYTWSGTTYTTGSGTVGYILENRTGSPATITSTLHILSLED